MSPGERVQFLVARNGGVRVVKAYVLRADPRRAVVCCDDGRVRNVNRRTCIREVSHASAA